MMVERVVVHAPALFPSLGSLPSFKNRAIPPALHAKNSHPNPAMNEISPQEAGQLHDRIARSPRIEPCPS